MAGSFGDIRTLSLCSGYGGLDLGLWLALRRRTRALAFVERDARAAASLLERMEESALDPAPIFGDLFAFDGRRLAGSVDVLAAGFPCQDHSAAGNRAGEDGERNLWPEVLRIADESEAPILFFENVRGILSSVGRPPVPGLDGERVGRSDGEPVRGGFLAGVLGDLAERGFDAEWSLLSAGDVGAPHRRERWWLLAANRQRLRQRGPASGGPVVGHANRRGLQGVGLEDDRGLEGASRNVPHRSDPRIQLWPPGPSEREAWARVPSEAQPAFRGGADGPAARLDDRDRLRMLGNGVVPLQAALAFRGLARRLGLDGLG